MSQQTTLYDAPGPRARRVTIISSIVVGLLVLVGVYFFVYKPLDARGEFDMDVWAPLIDPSDDDFSALWTRIGDGFKATLIAAVLAVVASLIVGTLLSIARIWLKSASHRKWVGFPAPVAILLRVIMVALDAISRIFVEVFRGLPVVITVVFVWLGLPSLGVELGDLIWYLVLGLVLYNSVVIAEILRSGMEGLPVGQREAAEAVGLSSAQTIRMILLPQAFRIMLPALISQLVVVLKDTSLGFIIGYEEILRITTQVVQILDNQIQMYVVVGTIYILINYGLSKLAGYVQRRLARGSKTRNLPVDAEPPAAIGAGVGGGLA
ncbi:amino acid ABC transporter permease [Actinoplanes sp. NBRC 103695]|uniref:amino acid ABC transporter permease n=1 Tax=Actinoplanes sp. NBRC 103695 TaxID=3032202 RepID=UPI0024A55183|nr:amino acid ABC transporter permease [Actinoplanes sp. NBRC 103695]GLY94769.1 glutamate ABC transporter permease [Actinoplanes sp. NBRC 103695]